MVDSLLFLSRGDIEALEIPFGEILEIVSEVFIQKGLHGLDSPPKRELQTAPETSVRAMKASVPHVHAAGVKWVAAAPGNVARGLPTISGLVVLNDPDTGLPLAVMDCTWITALRTAASTLVAAEMLAREYSSSVGLIACGLQGRANLRALCGRFPIERVRVYDVRPENALAFAQEMARELDVEIESVASIDRAVRDMDIVITSRPVVRSPAPSVPPGWLKPGSFACSLDFDATFSSAAIRDADLVVTDDIPQFRCLQEEGYLRSVRLPHADLGELKAWARDGRRSSSDVVICLNLGFGALDIACAATCYEQARRRGIGVSLPLWDRTDAVGDPWAGIRFAPGKDAS